MGGRSGWFETRAVRRETGILYQQRLANFRLERQFELDEPGRSSTWSQPFLAAETGGSHKETEDSSRQSGNETHSRLETMAESTRTITTYDVVCKGSKNSRHAASWS